MSKERIQLDSELDAALATKEDWEIEHLPLGRLKTYNEYANAINPHLYVRTPKAVFAALVVSLLSGGGESFERINELILHEWQVLHDNGIVPQKPPVIKE